MTVQQRKPVKGVGRVFAKLVQEASKRQQAQKLRRIDTEVFTVEGLAEFLHCSAAAVRGIPASELPRRRGPGRRVLYLREEVIRYLRRGERSPAGITPDMVRQAEAKVIGSESDSGRRPRRRSGQ